MSHDALNKRADRREFVAKLLAATPDALVVTGLGSPSYDVFAAGDRDKNYYLWGAMGGATSLGLGLALAQPDKSVVVVTGDGEQLMGIGSLGSIAVKQPKNLTIIVLDNGHFGETGMQRSHSSLGADLVGIAKGFGIPDAISTRSVDLVGEIAQGINARRGLAFVQVFIEADEPPRALPPRDGPFIKNRFRAALGLKPF
ncbi:aldehyde dehydrogenase [Variovorax sp. WS11]|uniref:thiamine pyrophosphate-dependent enzyme n=1 Tax=Variovorax sp. WS11 TaxID=1105204 RepID=UPI000D0DAD36|nr:thiamine pyrophosphate-dependent enzyme [Variovorax sp. WS11]NDZ18236.1 aldehyde dehydrogenase [Variovorax sp. WS11]PSL84241.1 aldehyde dehydrogenase [Variovorax sp. WS11]